MPALGLLINLYLMTQFGISNWALFFACLLTERVVYCGCGYKHSRPNKAVE